MTMMRWVLLTLAAVLLAGDGYVHGLWTGRWQTSHDLDDAAARLATVPMTIGDWQAEARTLPPRHVEIAGFNAYLARTYRHRLDDRVVYVMLACGRPGPLSVHTPEICYVGAGYAQDGPAQRDSFALGAGERSAEFWKAVYEKVGAAEAERLRVFWSWHAQGAWQSPDNPRWSFAGQPVIHKLYVTCRVSGSKEDSNNVVYAKFMEVFLAAVDKALFSAPDATATR